MSIYQPAAFAVPRDAALQLIHDFPFATLVTPGEGEPHISHLPLLYHSHPSQRDLLIGHMARANPHWKSFGGGLTLALFHGPHAYVSPSWYLDPAAAVPTWNYAVVHVYAKAIIATDRINVAANAAVDGRALARAGNVTLDSDTIDIPQCFVPVAYWPEAIGIVGAGVVTYELLKKKSKSPN